MEDDDDDADSVTASAADHSFVRLSKLIYDQYPESRPLSSPSLPPRCGFESLLAPTDPPESSRPHFRLYPRVEEVMTATCERAAALLRKMKPFSAVLPKKNRKHSVADVPDFATAPPFNPDFSRLTDNKTVSSKRWGSITFLEMDHMECVSRSLLEGISQSGILSQLKQAGFNPPDPSLFNTNISSVSTSISSQARSAAALADFLHRSGGRATSSMLRCLSLRCRSVNCWFLLAPLQVFSIRASWRSSPARLRRIPSSLPLCPWLRSPNLVLFVGVSPLPHRQFRQAPLKLGLRVISHLYFNVPPLTSAPPLLAEVVVLSTLRGAEVGLLRNPIRVFGNRSHIPVLP